MQVGVAQKWYDELAVAAHLQILIRLDNFDHGVFLWKSIVIAGSFCKVIALLVCP